MNTIAFYTLKFSAFLCLKMAGDFQQIAEWCIKGCTALNNRARIKTGKTLP